MLNSHGYGLKKILINKKEENNMTRDELKINIDWAAQQITELTSAIHNAYAELGKELYPMLANGEYAELTEKIKTAETNLSTLESEKSEMEIEYRRQTENATCFYCKTLNADDAVFCEECGKRLGEKPREYCDVCATMNNPGQKFCGECGAKLKEL